jgi:hypothetical protein
MDGTVQHGIELAAACAAAGFMAWAVRGRSSSVFGPSVWRGPLDRRAVALTFDDGPSESTPEILDILARHNVPATFFQCGANVERLPAVARAVGQAGHAIGNHSHTHPLFCFRSPASSNRTWNAPRRPSKPTPASGPPGSARPSARAGSGWAGPSGGSI